MVIPVAKMGPKPEQDRPTKVCKNCGAVTDGEYPGSGWVTVILLFFYIVPGILYEIWRQRKGRNICPVCKQSGLIPSDSPMGQELSKTYTPLEAIKEPPSPPENVTLPSSTFGYKLGFFLLFLAFLISTVATFVDIPVSTEGADGYIYHERSGETLEENVRSCCRSRASNCGKIIDDNTSYGRSERGRLTAICMQEMALE